MIGFVVDTQFRGSLLKQQRKVWARLIKDMKASGVKLLCIGGDLHEYATIGDRNAPASEIAAAFLDPIHEHQLPTIAIPGNHDIMAGKSSLDVYKHDTLVQVYNEACTLHVSKIVGFDCCLALLPWPLEPANPAAWYSWRLELLRVGLAVISPHTHKIMLAHMEIPGCKTKTGDLIHGCLYEVPMQEVLKVGADTYVFGHIHGQQGPYLGPPWNLNFGEAGNPTQWLLYRPDGTTQLREVEPTIRHYTLPANSSTETFSELDIIQFEASTANIPLPPRRDVELNPDGSLTEWLTIWAKHKEIPEETLAQMRMGLPPTAHTTEFIRRNTAGTKRVNYIELQNIGSITSTSSEFHPGWNGILGNSAIGKTFMLEALPGICYGSWPYQGRGRLPETATSPAFIQVEFEDAQDNVWLVNWEFEKDYKYTIFKRKDEEWIEERQLRTKPEFKEFLLGLLGPEDLFLSCSFMSQHASETDLLLAGPSKRMEMLRKFLGIEKFDVLTKEVKQSWIACTEERIRAENDQARLDRVLIEIEELHKQRLEKQPILEQVQAEETRLHNEFVSLVWKDSSPLQNQLKAINESIRFNEQKLQEHRASVALEKAKLEGQANGLRSTQATLQRQVQGLEGIGCKGLGDQTEHKLLKCRLITGGIEAAAQLQNVNEELATVTRLLQENRFGGIPAEQIGIYEAELGGLRIQRDKVAQAITAEQNNEAADKLSVQRKELRDKSTALASELGVIHHKLNELEKERYKLWHGLESRLLTHRKREEAKRLLHEAFGRNGIPQLLIDQAVPALQALLDDICQTDFENKFRLILSTQGETKDAEVFETFEIECVRGDRKPYKIAAASGAERNAIRTILHLVLMLYRMQTSKIHYGVAFLDEPTAHMDQFYTDCTMRMLKRLLVNFEQVIMVTHEPTLIAHFDHHVTLT